LVSGSSAHLDRLDQRTKPELGIVLENHKLLRVPDSRHLTPAAVLRGVPEP
jgi:hypothetical protein